MILESRSGFRSLGVSGFGIQEFESTGFDFRSLCARSDFGSTGFDLRSLGDLECGVI